MPIKNGKVEICFYFRSQKQTKNKQKKFRIVFTQVGGENSRVRGSREQLCNRRAEQKSTNYEQVEEQTGFRFYLLKLDFTYTL